MLRISAVHDASLWLRLRRHTSSEQRKWFLEMSRSNVLPNEVTHENLTRSAPSVISSTAVFVSVAVVAVVFLVHRKSTAH